MCDPEWNGKNCKEVKTSVMTVHNSTCGWKMNREIVNCEVRTLPLRMWIGAKKVMLALKYVVRWLTAMTSMRTSPEFGASTLD